MSTVQAQIWKSTAFSIDRLPGKVRGTVIFRFNGPFTARDMFGKMAPAAFHNIFELDSTSASAGRLTNIFDLTGVPYMDSAGLGVLVSHYVRCQGKGFRLIVAGAGPRVVQLFKLTKVDSFIPIAATVEEAESN